MRGVGFGKGRFYRGQSSAGTSWIGLGVRFVEAVKRLHDGSLALIRA
jgi:hypothetical protein